MRRIRLSRRMNFWFYSIFGVLFFSGLLWLTVHYGLLKDQNQFDSSYLAVESGLLKIHGASAMASLIVLGVLIPTHMRNGWKDGQNRLTASALITACLLLILSGYGLYYAGAEELRLWISNVHGFIGCLFPLILVWHIFSGREVRGKRVLKHK